MWYWYALGIYLCGMVVGFFVSAFRKGKDWDDHEDRWFPVICTFGWFLMLSFALMVLILYLFEEGLPKLFFGLLNRTAGGIESIKNYKPSQKHIVITTPIVNRGGYRDAAPKPCIACGTETSIDQSNMQVVEDEEESEDSYEIRKHVSAY